jgi:hypothetical protein
MTDEKPAPGSPGHQTDAEAHPERAVDDLEERVLGRRVDHNRNEDDEPVAEFEQDRDRPGPVAEQP